MNVVNFLNREPGYEQLMLRDSGQGTRAPSVKREEESRSWLSAAHPQNLTPSVWKSHPSHLHNIEVNTSVRAGSRQSPQSGFNNVFCLTEKNMDANNLLVESRVLQSGLLTSDEPARWMRDGRDRLLLLPSSLLDFCALVSRRGVTICAHRGKGI